MSVEKIIEDFGEMPEFLKDGMRIKYQISDLPIINKFCEKYCKKLVKIGLVHAQSSGSRLEPLYYFEGEDSGCTKEQLEISLQDTEAA